MGLIDELRDLKELRDTGGLTEAEFVQAKAALLSVSGGASRSGDALGDAAKTWVSFQIVMAIVGVVLAVIFFFGFFLPDWNKSQADFDRRWNEFPLRAPQPPGFGK